MTTTRSFAYTSPDGHLFQASSLTRGTWHAAPATPVDRVTLGRPGSQHARTGAYALGETALE